MADSLWLMELQYNSALSGPPFLATFPHGLASLDHGLL